MLLVHQAGSVKVGEVVRYTLEYTPSRDRILPTPAHLHLRIKNTSAIPYRAAWVHGPYALHVSAYPSTFNPHRKIEDPKRDGTPSYEPMVKAGGRWTTKLAVPETIRETGVELERRRSSSQHPQQRDSDREGRGSVTWIIEIASQILFSNSASVGFEVLVGRDEKSLDLGFAAVAGHGHGGPGLMKELHSEEERQEARQRGHAQNDGVYSKAVKLIAEDTEVLWDKPPLPSWDDEGEDKATDSAGLSTADAGIDSNAKQRRKKKRVHLVVVTHGLHSNIGADMLFLKESIDATVKQAREDAKQRRQSRRETQRNKRGGEEHKPDEDRVPEQRENDTSTAPLSGGQEDLDNTPGYTEEEDEDEEEETIVRGFTGNAVRTENGIQYLGKRLAKYVLRFTYPDQPFLPIKRTLTRRFTDTFTSDADKAKRDGKAVHEHSGIHKLRDGSAAEELPYKFTSISFVGHSLGGLIQTYAVAYIHKHSPTFFKQIEPINFICMASPMLGLSNENPMYVRFALDFGLVGRTGQDLGLTWRPPTLASKGWNAVVGGFSSNNQKEKDTDPSQKQQDPSAKPLLRVLPTGPAHQVLKMFRNRTLYSNVVNDGIVPLRTSCLLFLDWRGLGKVDKARRENGLIGTVAEWGWAEITGANSSSMPPNVRAEQAWESDEDNEQVRRGKGDDVPLPAEDETAEDNKLSASRFSYEEEGPTRGNSSQGSASKPTTPEPSKGVIDTFFDFFRSKSPEPSKPPHTSKKTSKTLRRAQTINHENDGSSDNASEEGAVETISNPTIRPRKTRLHSSASLKRPRATRGDSLTNGDAGEPQAPPKTSIFESAGDVLHPPLPSEKWITDPGARARTIFHDRVYHPDDIPPPPVKRSNTRHNPSISSTDTSANHSQTSESPAQKPKRPETSTSTGSGGMKIEEKIARAYHRDLSWRKVLVRLEPDAHNNMIVRRMFANAYGWPVIKHLCDTHFADTIAATTRDDEEPSMERAKPMDVPIDPYIGEQVDHQTDRTSREAKRNEMREAQDELVDLNKSHEGAQSSYSSNMSTRGYSRQDSFVWDDSFFEGSDGEDSDAVDERNLVAKLLNPNYALPKKPQPAHRRHETSSVPSSPVTPTYTDGHRGLAPMSPRSPRSPQEVKAQTPGNSSTKPTFDSQDVEIQRITSHELVNEPDAFQSPPGSSSGAVGLGKSVEEQIGPMIKPTKGAKHGTESSTD